MSGHGKRGTPIRWILAYAALALVVAGAAVAFLWNPAEDRGPLQVIDIPKPAPFALIEGDDAAVVVPNGEPGAVSFALSAALYESAPAVIVASPDTLADAASEAATPLPILVLPAEPGEGDLAALRAESERLQATGWIAHGVSLPAEFTAPRLQVETAAAHRTVLVDGDPTAVQLLLGGTDWTVIESTGDPRASGPVIEALAEAPDSPAVVVGNGSADIQWQIATARTGQLLPTGTQIAAPDALYVALYGHPWGGSLGVLGEQGVAETIVRAEKHAAPYRELVDVPVIPSLEIIATVASASAGADGDYSAETPIEDLLPLIDAAGEAGMYVVIDLQPGRTDFLTQAKMYEELLLRPYVGLALDPEWRIKPDQVHLVQIGQVDAAEINTVVEWLADLTRANSLPQKIFILHSFQTRMITNIDQVNTSRSELATVMHVDGQGGQGAKQDTWRVLHNYAPNIENWGWKNFYDEDTPAMLTPSQTIELVHPRPLFISYQ